MFDTSDAMVWLVPFYDWDLRIETILDNACPYCWSLGGASRGEACD
jgi:hypothetical protein